MKQEPPLILLVEDEALIAMAEKLSLEANGYAVVVEHSGEKAVEAVKGRPGINLVLMDIDLGRGIGGPEAASRILAMRTLPIVFLSSHSEREMVEKVRGITRYGYVIKNSGDFVLRSSIEMAFELFDASQAVKAGSEVLRERNQLLENIMDKFPGSVFWKDLNSVYLGCNAAEAHEAGLASPKDIIGKTDYDLWPREGEADNYRMTDRMVMESGEPILHIKEIHRLENGASSWDDTSKVPLFDGRGRISGVFGVSIDITERMLAEEALRESENRLSDLIFGSADWIWEIDENDVYTFSSQRGLDFLGRSREEVIGRTPFDFMPTDEAKRMSEVFSVIKARKAPVKDLENWIVGKRGESVCLLTNAVPILDGQGNLKGYRGVDKDITERKAAERAAEKRITLLTGPNEGEAISFEDFFELEEIQRIQDEFSASTGVASLITAADGRPITAPSGSTYLCSEIVQKTEAGCSGCREPEAAIGGFGPEGPALRHCMGGGLWIAEASIAVGGRHVANWQIGQVRDEAKADEEMRAYAAGIGADEASFMRAFRELPAMSRDRFGKIAAFLFSLSAQLSASAYDNLMQARAIAERDRVEAALEGERRLMRALMDNLPAQIYFKDRDSRFVRVNKAQARLFGLGDPEEAVGKTDFDFFSEEHARRAFADESSIVETGLPIVKEERITWPDGSGAWFSTTKLPLRDEEGSIVGSFGVSEDIAERKTAEGKIQDLLKEKELILKEVHHRIKNNMNAVFSLLKLQAGTLRETGAAAALEDAASRVQSMMLLYEKLFRSASFTAISIKEYLSPLVDEIVAGLSQGKTLEVEKRIDDFLLGPSVLQPLGIIVNELLTNLMKHAFSGRERGRISVAASMEGRVVAISIEDDGKGMPDSVDFENSTGFGLMLVGELTRQIGGTIRIERADGTRIILNFEN
jgi:PAS domain S-box-containing protein